MPEVIMLHPRTNTPVIVQKEDEEEFLKRGYLPEGGAAAETSDDAIGNLTVPELKQRLADAGLETGGKKAELVDRLRSAEESAGSATATDGGEGTGDEDGDGGDAATNDAGDGEGG